MNYHLYILFSKSKNKYYIGHTNNLERRLNEHNAGQTASTKSGVPWDLIFTKTFSSNIEANSLEIKLKRMKSRKYIEWFIDNNS